MPGEDIHSWSTTAANNDDADTLINWREGMARAAVNDSARSLMAAHAKNRNLNNGSITTTGTANAQAFVSGVGYTAIATGMRVLLKLGFSNTGPATLNMDGIGAAPIKNLKGEDIADGELRADSYSEFLYDGTNWIVMQTLGTVTIINTTTIVNSAAGEFVDGITDEFDEYIFSGVNIVPSTNAVNMYLQVSEDAGATWKGGATDYRWTFFNHTDAGLSATIGSGVAPHDFTKMLVGLSLYNVAAAGINFNIRMYNTSTTASWKFFESNSSYVASPLVVCRGIGAGMYTSTNVINGVRFFMSSGNIATGTIRLYGIQK